LPCDPRPAGHSVITIKKNSEFVTIYKNGRRFTGKYLILYAREGKPGYNAIGVTASKKTGNSVRRNRLRRVVKENYRHMEVCLHVGFLFVFVVRARQDGYLPDFYDIGGDMKSLLSRAGALDHQKWENLQKGAL